MKQLSIIIVNWNGKDLIGRCLESVYRHTVGLDFEVIVVDNGSSDGSLDVVRARFPQVRLLENGANLGFAKASNRGIQASEGRCVVLLNQDTELRDNSLRTLYDFLASDAQVGACGGRLIYPGGAPQWSYGYAPSLSRMLWITLSRVLGIRAGRKPDAVVPADMEQPIRVEYIVGADLMVKREVLDSAGLLDESFFAYFEEVDLCMRIRRAGHDVWYLPQCTIIHHITETRDPWKARVYYTSLFRFLKKNRGYYRPVRALLLAKFWLQTFRHASGEQHEEACFRLKAIRESVLDYPPAE